MAKSGDKNIARNCTDKDSENYNNEDIRTETVINEGKWMFKASAMYLAIGKGYSFG